MASLMRMKSDTFQIDSLLCAYFKMSPYNVSKDIKLESN